MNMHGKVTDNSILKKTIAGLHAKYSHPRRVIILSEFIAAFIKKNIPTEKKLKCLDVGCGDMQIAEHIAGILPNTSWTCIDTFHVPENNIHKDKWVKYIKFDGVTIPFEKKAFDIVLFCDVLHHAGDAMLSLLKQAGCIADYVLIKDHLEYSWYSRFILRLMDIYGNWGYGVSIPRKYFTTHSFRDSIALSELSEMHLHVGIELYPQLPLLRIILKPEYHFI